MEIKEKKKKKKGWWVAKGEDVYCKGTEWEEWSGKADRGRHRGPETTGTVWKELGETEAEVGGSSSAENQTQCKNYDQDTATSN